MTLLEDVFGKKSGRREFATLATKAFTDKGIQISNFDEQHFSLTLGNGILVHLDNVHAEFLAARRDERGNVLDRFASAFARTESVPDDFAIARSSLLPVVRSKSYFSLSNLSELANKKDASSIGEDSTEEELTDDLVVRVAFDAELTTNILGKKKLEKWGVDFEEAFRAATDNLREITDAALYAEVFPGLYEGQWADSYESSRMLLPDLMLALPLNGEPIVCVPRRNKLWVCGSGDEHALRRMIQLGDTCHFEAYPLSPYLHSYCDGQWSTFIPDRLDLRESLASIERRRLSLDYGQQKQHLESIYEQDGKDVFVATFVVFEKSDLKAEFSACVWSNGVDSSLPRTEKIILLISRETKERLILPWDVASEAIGHLMEKEPNLAPERYRVRSFPGDQELSLLRSMGYS